MILTVVDTDKLSTSFRDIKNGVTDLLKAEDSPSSVRPLWTLVKGKVVLQTENPTAWERLPGAKTAKSYHYGRPEQGSQEMVTCLFKAEHRPSDGGGNKITVNPRRAPWWFAHRLVGVEVLDMVVKPEDPSVGSYRATGHVKVIDPDEWVDTRLMGIGRNKARGYGLIYDPRIVK